MIVGFSLYNGINYLYEVKIMAWLNYMILAAQHSKNSASHWFKYLRKDIYKFGISFSKEEFDNLCKNESLTPFQRVSIRAAFQENSLTRQYILNLNNPASTDLITEIRRKRENSYKSE